MSGTFANIEDAVNERSNNSSGTDSSEERDDLPYVRAVPTTVFGGEITDVRYMGQVATNEGIVEQQSYEDDTAGDWMFRLRNPVVLKGTAFSGDDTEGVQYRIFDTDHEQFNENYDQDGELKSVDSNGMRESYNGVEVESIPEDEVVVFTGGLAGQFITRALDANGGQSAYITDEGVNTNGLIEYPPSWDNGIGDDGLKPRVARYPQLRDDLDGEEIFIVLKDAGGNRVDGHVGLIDDLGLDELGEDESLPPEAIADAYLGRVRDQSAPDYDSTLAWHEAPDDASANDSGPSGDFDIGSDDDGASDDTDSAFTDAEDEFIEQIVSETMNDGDTVDDVFADFDAVVDSNRAKNVDGEALSLRNTVSADDLRAAINDANS